MLSETGHSQRQIMQPVRIYKLIAGIFGDEASARGAGVISALLVCFALLVPLGTSTAFARLRYCGEYQVKAAFLFNFANFVEWPDEAFPKGGRNFVICVIGGDQFGGALDSLKGKILKGRIVIVRYCAEAADARGSQILFVGRSELGNINRIFKTLKGCPVLTVADQDRFCQAGGMINMIKERNRVGFEINVSAARRAGLQISSHLLKLAKEIMQ